MILNTENKTSDTCLAFSNSNIRNKKEIIEKYLILCESTTVNLKDNQKNDLNKHVFSLHES